MKSRNVAEEHELTPDNAERLTKKLVNHYPAHGFVISRTEARDELGLPIESAEDHPRWLKVKEFHSNFEQSDEDDLVMAMTDIQFDAQPSEQ